MEELKPITISFKKKNSEEVELAKILAKKSSAAAFIKDTLIDLLVRGSNKRIEIYPTEKYEDKNIDIDKDEISEIFGLK